MTHRTFRIGAVAIACALVVPLTAGAAAAHPLGNFTVNYYTGIVVSPDAVTVNLVVDTAEIPTFQRRPDIDRNGDDTLDDAERSAFRVAECAKEVGRLQLTVDGRSTPLAVGSGAVTFPAGSAGLDTMRLTCTAAAAVSLAGGGSRVSVVQRAGDTRIGWREITARGDGVTLSDSSVPADSVSAELTAYPEDLLASPLDVTSATLTARPGGDRLAPGAPAQRSTPLARGVDGASAAFQKYVGRRELTPPIALASLFLALLLGAVHALAPGHGKTVMAAFIVGERGSLRQAWIIGLTVTVTHTAGVLVLGIILTATDLAAPQRIYGLLGVASGILLGSVGIILLTRALRQRALQRSGATTPATLDAAAPSLVSAGHVHDHPHDTDHGHDHPHDTDHGHLHDDEHDHGHADDHGHDHGDVQDHGDVHSHDDDDGGRHRHGLFSHSHVVPTGDKPLGWRSIVAMGFAGGLVPSPSALVVLLGAVALGRTWFGVVLVVAYGAGMALTLTGTGLLLSRASQRLGAGAANFGPRMQRAVRIARLLPIATAVVVLTVGVVIAYQGLAEAF